MTVCLNGMDEGLLLRLLHPSRLLPICLSQIPFNMLSFSFSSKSDQRSCPRQKGERKKWKEKKKKKKSWIFHRNRFIKILLRWNFATREALTRVSLCAVSRQILARATKRHSLTWNPLVTKYIIHTLTSQAHWRLFSIRSEWIFVTSIHHCLTHRM